jgi:hypothetical protein
MVPSRVRRSGHTTPSTADPKHANNGRAERAPRTTAERTRRVEQGMLAGINAIIIVGNHPGPAG